VQVVAQARQLSGSLICQQHYIDVAHPALLTAYTYLPTHCYCVLLLHLAATVLL
jgi:hypothetical protein